MMRKGKIILLVLLCTLRGTVQSQDFKWKSALDTVHKTGFYSIPLGLDWLIRLKTDISDIRIKNGKNEVVPFIKQESPQNALSQFYLHPKTPARVVDSANGNTYVWIDNDQAIPADRLSMKVSGPRFFKRNVTVYKLEGEKIPDLLGNDEFTSMKDPVVWLRGDKARILLAVIENGDNPALKIESVNTQSRKRQLVAYLEEGETYYLVGGNETAVHPQYDLAQFRDSIPNLLEEIHHSGLVANTAEIIQPNEDRRLWLWPSIVLMIGILGLLTLRLTREMRKKGI